MRQSVFSLVRTGISLSAKEKDVYDETYLDSGLLMM